MEAHAVAAKLIMTKWTLRILETPLEMEAVEELQRRTWPGSETDIVPAHLLLAAVHNGGLVVGVYAGPAGPAVFGPFGYGNPINLGNGLGGGLGGRSLIGRVRFRVSGVLHHARWPAPEALLAYVGRPPRFSRSGVGLCAQTRPMADGASPGRRPHHLDLRPPAQPQRLFEHRPAGGGLQHLFAQ